MIIDVIYIWEQPLLWNYPTQMTFHPTFNNNDSLYRGKPRARIFVNNAGLFATISISINFWYMLRNIYQVVCVSWFCTKGCNTNQFFISYLNKKSLNWKSSCNNRFSSAGFSLSSNLTMHIAVLSYVFFSFNKIIAGLENEKFRVVPTMGIYPPKYIYIHRRLKYKPQIQIYSLGAPYLRTKLIQCYNAWWNYIT